METKSDVIEYSDYLRTRSNYLIDLESPENERVIKEQSIFNTLSSFHVTENFVFDIMHDLLEGVFDYEFSHILHYFIEQKKNFTLEMFNHRKQHFAYGESEIKNRGLPIQMSNIRNHHFKMTARQMLTFAFYFPLVYPKMIKCGSSF